MLDRTVWAYPNLTLGGPSLVVKEVSSGSRAIEMLAIVRQRRHTLGDKVLAVGCSANAEAPKIYIKPVAQRSGRPRVILGFAEPILLGAAAETEPETHWPQHEQFCTRAT